MNPVDPGRLNASVRDPGTIVWPEGRRRNSTITGANKLAGFCVLCGQEAREGQLSSPHFTATIIGRGMRTRERSVQLRVGFL